MQALLVDHDRDPQAGFLERSSLDAVCPPGGILRIEIAQRDGEIPIASLHRASGVDRE
jgi:hypothetical protein